jgi:D-tyrosyl-tRNA(Tyr) deacylase
MRAVVQRVLNAGVTTAGFPSSGIGPGLLVFLGIAVQDGQREIDWMTRKIANLRIFEDESGKMNLSVKDCSGELLIVSQFTLHADVSRGNRPGFSGSAGYEAARPVFDRFVEAIRQQSGLVVRTGYFGEHMHVSLVNDGPVTLIIDSTEIQ